MENDQTLLRQIIKRFYPLPLSDLSLIEALISYEQLPKGEQFIALGQRNSHEYFLLGGICKSYLISPKGENVTLSFFTEGSILSPHATRTRAERSILNFETLTPCRIAVMNAKKFEQLMLTNIEIRNFGYEVSKNELAQKIDKEIGLASLTAMERLLQFRSQFPMLENRISHADIASYLGITNISLSRLRGSLSK